MSVAVVDRDHAFLAAVRSIADEVAAIHADAVDREARFPQEAVSALRTAGALSALVPEPIGGGVSLEAVARACFELARCCSSTAMVFAM
ncbi:MAG: acyl-CoA dehydrogenase family protein, partial [Solirubrobacteraceae bacterium]